MAAPRNEPWLRAVPGRTGLSERYRRQVPSLLGWLLLAAGLRSGPSWALAAAAGTAHAARLPGCSGGSGPALARGAHRARTAGQTLVKRRGWPLVVLGCADDEATQTGGL